MTELPKGWSYSRLDEVATIIRGVTYSSKDVMPSGLSDAVMLLRATNIQKGVLDLLDPVWIPRALVKPQQMLIVGDLVIASSSGSIQIVGKSASVKNSIDATFGGFCTTVRAKSIEPGYLAHYLQDPTLRQKWSDLAGGSNINNLKTTDIAATPIPVPPLEEQKRIVETLDDRLSRLDKALAETQNAQRKTETFIKSYLLSIVEGKSKVGDGEEHWGKRQVGSLGKWRGGGTPSKSNPLFWVDGTIPWITAKDMKTFRITDTQDHITALGVSGSSANLLPSKSVVVVTRSGILEWKLPVAVTEVPVTVNQDLKALVCHPDVLPDWAAYSILGFEHRVLDECRKAGTTVANLNFDDFLKFEILLPPLEVQNTLVAEIVSSLDYLNSIRVRVDEIAKSIQSMRRSLLKSAFSGELLKVR
jgi:type I restriction enzyme S subunit